MRASAVTCKALAFRGCHRIVENSDAHAQRIPLTTLADRGVRFGRRIPRESGCSGLAEQLPTQGGDGTFRRNVTRQPRNRRISSMLTSQGSPMARNLPTVPHHVGIINDYVRIPYANGSSFASQFLYRELTRRGHDVTVLGPREPGAPAGAMPRRAVLFDSIPLRNHPGLFLALPSQQALASAVSTRLDMVLAQTGSGLLDLGVWLRAKSGVPLLCVNTIHLPSVYNVILPDALHQRPGVKQLLEDEVVPRIERLTASAYNASDGLVVLSTGLERYWRQRGVTVPIHVIPRCVDPTIFDAEGGADPLPRSFKRGARLLCVCRHTREKGLDRLLRVFARQIAPHAADATLTLVGDGAEHDEYRRTAERLGVSERVHFAGEVSLPDMPRYYRNTDLFVYASLSETYGQVVSEALWCGLPVVAFADGMGVSQQVASGRSGELIDPSGDAMLGDARFGSAVLELLRDRARRNALGDQAQQLARERCAPVLSINRYYEAFINAREHCSATWSPPAKPHRAAYLARWAALHTLLAGLGHVRAPATLNRHARAQPAWDEPAFRNERRAGRPRGDLVRALSPT